MPDSETTTEKARRWTAFVCPDCRFVFRVPRDHDGTGIVCPSCRRMLRIPTEEDFVAPLMAPIQKVGFTDGEIDPRGEKRTRSKRKRKHKEAESPDWDASAGKWKATRSDRGFRKTKLLLAALFVVGAGGLAVVFLETAEHPDDWEDFADLSTGNDTGLGLAEQLLLPEHELAGEIELPDVLKRSEVDFLEEAEPLARKFLNSTSVGEILPLVRNRSKAESRIRTYYPDGRIEPLGITGFNSTGRPSYKDNFAAVGIRTSDFEERQLAFVDGEEGLKIDWESWVGWSEYPWQDLLVKRPTRPVLVRAMLKWVDYYNFDFTDESKWRSYRLVSPDGEHLLFGYVPRNSLLDQRMRPSQAGSTVAMTLMIRFPKSGSSQNQVIIEDQVADGWVLSE